MKKIFLGLIVLIMGTGMGFSQKFAFVNTDYILGRIPAYDASQKQLDKLATDWQKEIEDKRADIEKLYKDSTLGKKLSNNAYAKVKNDFSIDKTIEQLCVVYRGLIRE